MNNAYTRPLHGLQKEYEKQAYAEYIYVELEKAMQEAKDPSAKWLSEDEFWQEARELT